MHLESRSISPVCLPEAEQSGCSPQSRRCRTLAGSAASASDPSCQGSAAQRGTNPKDKELFLTLVTFILSCPPLKD